MSGRIIPILHNILQRNGIHYNVDGPNVWTGWKVNKDTWISARELRGINDKILIEAVITPKQAIKITESLRED